MSRRERRGVKDRRNRVLRAESLESRRLLALSPELVVDINPVTGDSEPWQLTPVGNDIYVLATDYLSPGYGLWKLDPTTREGTRIAQFSQERIDDCGHLESNHPDPYLEAVGDDLYFATDFGKDLWRTDGTVEGTVLLHKFTTRIQWMHAIGDRVVFDADDGVHGREIWTSDGTPDGTRMIDDMSPGSASFVQGDLRLGDGAFIFKGMDSRLWRSDGTIEGTYRLTENGFVFQTWPGNVGGQLYFWTDGELYRTNGSAEGTVRIAPNFPVEDPVISYREMIEVAGRQYLWSSHTQGRAKLWWTEDDGATMHFVADIPSVRSSVGQFVLGNVLLFPTTLTGGYLRTDGTPEGTYELIQYSSENGFFQEQDFWEYRGQLVYRRNGELWRTDGTIEGSYAITEYFLQGGESGQRPSFIVHDGRLYLSSRGPAAGMEVYEMIGQPGDTNFDGSVDLADLNNVRNHFGEVGNVLGDANGDGVVDLVDLNDVRNNFGAQSGAAAVTSADSRVRRPIGAIPDSKATNLAARERLQDALFVASTDMNPTRAKGAALKLRALDRLFAMY